MASAEILEGREELRSEMLKSYSRTPETLKMDIESIKEWAKKQTHLPEIPSDVYIEAFLFLSKFVFAKTKTIIDLYYTFKGIVPEVFQDPESPAVRNATEVAYCLPLPKLTQDKYRVIVHKLRIADYYKNIDAEGYVCFLMIIVEILLIEDCFSTKIFFCDFKDIRLEHISIFPPLLIKKVVKLFEQVFSTRVHEVHFLNASPYLEPFFTLIKSFMKPKIANRLRFHKNAESVFEYVPKEIFPEDYGGSEKSLEALRELWIKKIQDSTPMLRQRNLLRTDESKRREGTIDSEILGMEGNFRKLDVD